MLGARPRVAGVAISSLRSIMRMTFSFPARRSIALRWGFAGCLRDVRPSPVGRHLKHGISGSAEAGGPGKRQIRPNDPDRQEIVQQSLFRRKPLISPTNV